MSVVTWSIFIIIFTVEFIIGSLGNGFIAVLYYIYWTKRGKISLADKILTGLAVSRIFFIWLTVVNILLHMFPSDFLNIEIFPSVLFLWSVASHFSTWFATCLSIFYFFKIANFSNSTFLYLKWRIKKVVSVTLLASLVLLFANIVLLNIHGIIWVDEHKRNASFNSKFKSYGRNSKFIIYIFIFWFVIPFQVSLTTSLLLIFSLRKHLKRMQHSAKGPRDASTTAHIKALHTVITFLLLYTIFFISQVFQVWDSNLIHHTLAIFLCQTAGMAFPSGHSCVLILANTKLRQGSLSMLWWLRRSLKS
ncbi:taste receptor type 2 member 140-like [Nannospalax galili]|uniref:Taste receptor type 2 n=1 Tax=Nannospalax galili TaxID=1026970 RepID=A0A7S6B5X2_NANGA|nr:taste receptor type 2 member 140-like [Nannospalax galili]QKE46561.1 taste receptor type 2 member 587 [Nannospalax galili]QKE46563.1 taste receptor type 2 member 587 [Nannospalax galili]QKE46567.1 taste receptor type 2 member 587 [Nannospalax galili]QKE46569.1 taste receptor type 2 member 587 [Nannospalax galili]QKE46575.1 taste receptor type 2 member 587 [Nannospalax galili]